MKTILAAAALSMIVSTGTFAQTNGSSAATSPSSATASTDSQGAAGQTAQPKSPHKTSASKNSSNQTGTKNAPPGTEPSTGVPVDGTEASPGAKGSNSKK